MATPLFEDQILTLTVVDKNMRNPTKLRVLSEQYENIGCSADVYPNLEWQVTTETMPSKWEKTPFFNGDCRVVWWELSLPNLLPRRDGSLHILEG